MTTRIAVIPARGGSTRLKNKNIFSLDGKPLIRWITEAVIRSESFDKVVISTDDDKIFNAVSDLDVVRHIRPANHATTKATALNAMLNLMQDEEKHDVFAYFLPTAPLTTAEDIKNGVKLLTSEIDSVVSITEMPEPIQKACLVKNDWVIPVFDNLTAGLTNSKFIQKYHTPTGAFYISWWDKLLKNKNFFKGQVKGVIIPKHRSVDIDDIVDIKTAEAILER
jgi:CMP-N-acetylneuraminic acid synthetase